MYQSKAEAIEALSSLVAEMNCILSEDDHNDDELEAIQGEIEAQYEEIEAAIAQIKRYPKEYLQVEERNYVMLTVLEAKRTIAEATDLIAEVV